MLKSLLKVGLASVLAFTALTPVITYADDDCRDNRHRGYKNEWRNDRRQAHREWRQDRREAREAWREERRDAQRAWRDANRNWARNNGWHNASWQGYHSRPWW